jgi:GMP synthase (glutamine-hydrolysing)
VFAGPAKEIGWGCIALTDAGRGSCLQPLSDPDVQVLHWHGDTFDLPQVLHWHGDTFDLPDGATRLASTALYENQAFAFGRHALALQFHIEADAKGLEQWFVGHAAELAAAKISVPGLRAATATFASRLTPHSCAIFTHWVQHITRKIASGVKAGDT